MVDLKITLEKIEKGQRQGYNILFYENSAFFKVLAYGFLGIRGLELKHRSFYLLLQAFTRIYSQKTVKLRLLNCATQYFKNLISGGIFKQYIHEITGPIVTRAIHQHSL